MSGNSNVTKVLYLNCAWDSKKVMCSSVCLVQCLLKNNTVSGDMSDVLMNRVQSCCRKFTSFTIRISDTIFLCLLICFSIGNYPLHLAAFNGHADVCRILINSGPSRANVNEQVGIN